ncbi:MAG: DNA/RNA nuclease SfsA [Spirochaetales bacterium]|nr:MAG: DNA/RNA nuclease SfsA [Spirochaetales bacterium]
MKLFSPGLEASFVSRPNRFLVVAKYKGRLVRAHCPNPGRVQEILLPGAPLLLSRAEAPLSGGPSRKTEYTLEAARYKGKIIPLYSGKANLITRNLVIPSLFPRAEKVIAEASAGRSRFDFYIENEGSRFYLEVKACTLCEYGIASFPDAPTERGTRHLLHLAEIANQGAGAIGAHVLFVLMHPDAGIFVPAIHTDPLFSRTLLHVRDLVKVHAVSVRADESGEVSLENSAVPVCYGPVDWAIRNAGIYFLVCRLDSDRRITVGSLGPLEFRAGFYIYAGSGKGILRSRISRHLSKKKKAHWHIDYLTLAADGVKAFPVYTARPEECGKLECGAAENLKDITDFPVPGFGAGGCGCGSHLFYMKEDPLRSAAFTGLVFYCRYGTMRESLAGN